MTELDINVNQLLDEIAEKIRQLPQFSQAPKMIGVQTGGVWLTEALQTRLQLADTLGTLNNTFYRDDFATSGLNSCVEPSNIPWDLNDQHVILVDDVIYTGRTIRAALNEIFDYGRPASITLVILLDRQGSRELPFQADIAGMRIENNLTVKLIGPDPLTVICPDSTATVTKEAK